MPNLRLFQTQGDSTIFVSVTNLSVISHDVILHCAFFYSSDPNAWKFQKIEFPERLYTRD